MRWPEELGKEKGELGKTARPEVWTGAGTRASRRPRVQLGLPRPYALRMTWIPDEQLPSGPPPTSWILSSASCGAHRLADDVVADSDWTLENKREEWYWLECSAKRKLFFFWNECAPKNFNCRLLFNLVTVKNECQTLISVLILDCLCFLL